jgi:hypothetical protein
MSMTYSSSDSYELYLRLRRLEQQQFCARHGFTYQSSSKSGGGSDYSYHTQNNVANFVSSSSNRSSDHSHTSSNCIYRSLKW